MCSSSRMDKRAKLVTEVIESLKRFGKLNFSSRQEYQKIVDNAEDCLFAIYKAGISQVKFTPEEKTEIGPLVHQSLPALGSRISYIVSHFPPTSVENSKIERSGLQFVLDDFKDLPASTGSAATIEKDLSDFEIAEDIEGWDDYLKNLVVDYLSPDADWGCEDVQKWKTEAKKQQQTYFELLGDRDWDVVDKGEWTLLRQKVGYGVYGPPSTVPTEGNKYTGYDDKQLEHIEKICVKLKRNRRKGVLRTL
ncbi:unnamed protein product [Allacma fusca]|uniref:Uncharacterized protein n=1 Tax=Allacma fusca TaxID=39272 RepID=A0A8J2PR82_9HEXA|nr:unnamed protein product [Allacma fusca]